MTGREKNGGSDVSPLRVAIVGLGTVGTGVVKLLQDHAALLALRAGRAIEIVAVCARDPDKARDINLTRYKWVSDPMSLIQNQATDVIVELVGGSGGVARDIVGAALGAGISVVTANKALLAHHGYELSRLSEDNNAALMFEAAVAGGIPIIKTVRDGLAGNEIRALYGILNGTCNYILTEMRETGRDFADVLADAQKLGYAEADPAFDIDGIDAAHKLALLSALAFGHRPDFKHIRIAGITKITAQDIKFADELGFRIKLLGIARRMEGKILQRVEPCLVPTSSAIGAVEGVFNAVFIDSDFAGRSLSYGRGAGEKPTASAVVADLIDLARGDRRPVFGIPADSLTAGAAEDEGLLASEYYMRLTALDKPGVLAEVSAILRDCQISVESILQRGRDPGNPVSIVIVTHPVRDRDIGDALERLAGLSCMVNPPGILRIESFN